MVSISRRPVEKAIELLAGPSGVGENLATVLEAEGISTAGLPPCQVLALNMSAELAEKSFAGRYPAVYVRCEQVVNSLKEKFRQFSGKVRLCAEVRVSHDRLEEIDRLAHHYATAVMRVLEQNRGDWGEGMFYGGGYETAFSQTKHGGKNFLQSAAVRFEVDVSL